MMNTRVFSTVLLFLLVVLPTAPAVAALDGAPSRVGRISVIIGNVSLKPARGDWTQALVNMPVAVGMAVRTESGDGRAELRIGDQRIAVAAGTELSFAALDEQITQIAVKRGRVGIELRRLGSDESVEIDIPRGGVWLLAAGQYDIEGGTETGPARVAAFDGRARFVGSGDDSLILANSAAFLGRGEPIFAEFKPAVADEFTEWWRALGTGDRILPALLHISPAMTGIEALDDSGHWETSGNASSVWGPVWFADAVPDDWAPYRYGRWRWLAPWGWTWIDDAAWGFAPSHYGRWAHFVQPGTGTERWGWVPGKPIDDPAYAPAVVGFLGTAGVGLSYADAGGPAYAWFPLAPGEIYRPNFTHDIDAIRHLNAGSVQDLTAIELPSDGYAPGELVGGQHPNRRFASAIPRAAFLAGQAVPPALVQIPETRLETAPLITEASAFPPPPTPPAPRAVVASSAAAKLAAAAAARVVVARVAVSHAAAAHVAASATLATARQNAGSNLRGLARSLVARPVVTARAIAPRRNTTVAVRPQKITAVATPHHPAGRTHLAAAAPRGR